MATPAVLLVSNYDNNVGYAWNNIYRLFNAIGRTFAARGLGVCVSFPEIHPPLTVLDGDVPWQTFVFNPHRTTRAALAEARKTFRRLNVRYVYLTDHKPARWDYAVLRSMGVRHIVVHSRISVPNPYPVTPEQGPRRILKRAWGLLPMVNADRVYAVSEFVRQRLVAKACLPEARVKTILNGIDVDAWACPPRKASAAPVVFFACSRAARYKGIPTLIEAGGILRRRLGVENFVIRYAGDGPDLDLFARMVESQGLERHFAFLGRLEGTRSAVIGADVIVVPSAYGDACPSTVSEGLASGRPLIATRAGGIAELVGDERNAVLVPPNNAEELADAMARLAANPAARIEIAARGRSRAESDLRQDVYHEKVITNLLEDFRLE